MRFSYQWLGEWVKTDLGPQALGERLTMAGLELDAIEPAAPAFTGVVVGRIAGIEPHPDADKLRVCQVEDAGGALVPVVCGAPNAALGLIVPFARVGAKLPDGMKIKKAKLRGVVSQGMLCSARELGLSEQADGLLALPPDAPIGEDLRVYLGLDDQVLDVDLTPNRADCLSIVGIARESALLTGVQMTPPTIEAVAAQHTHVVPVDIDAPQACPHYVGRVIEGVDVAASTPIWMQERLRRCGIRSLGPVVDVTNYVLLELGQPMHAFDLAALSGGITVRLARKGESLVLLDGQEIHLKEGSLLICDTAGPLALAGIMGGQGSAVGTDTQDIFLESAFFAPEAIAGHARHYGLHTDSSHRFERGVDPALQVRAIERATALLLAIAGGRPGPLIEAGAPSLASTKKPIMLRSARIKRLLGVEIADADILSIVQRLGCSVEAVKHGWQIIPPSYRFDLAIEADFIEEVARVHGYERIPSLLRAYEPVVRREPEAAVSRDRMHLLLVERGYQEAITYSFVDPQTEALIAPGVEPLALVNPISSEMAVMRSSLWSGLIKAAAHNLNRQQSRVRLFESGLRFLPQEGHLLQTPALAGLICGDVLPEQWGVSPSRAVDFFDMKGDVEAVLALTGQGMTMDYRAEPHPALHPGQSARIYRQGEAVGWLGALHPRLEKTLNLDRSVFVFELDLQAINQGTVSKFSELSRFPAIRRDIALLLDEAVSWRQIEQTITALAIDTIREFYLFDVYTGDGVPKGRKSLALGLILQDLSRTLTDDEVEQIKDLVVMQLAKDLGASLRV